MPTTKSRKKPTLTRKRAVSAAKKARKQYQAKPGKKSQAWKAGGEQWARVLGHFGLSA